MTTSGYDPNDDSALSCMPQSGASVISAVVAVVVDVVVAVAVQATPINVVSC